MTVRTMVTLPAGAAVSAEVQRGPEQTDLVLVYVGEALTLVMDGSTADGLADALVDVLAGADQVVTPGRPSW